MQPRQIPLRCFQVKYALQTQRRDVELQTLTLYCLVTPLGETTMRWKISRDGHDPRQVDLLAVIAIVLIIVAAWRYFGESSEPPSTTAFIVPSQSTHW
jgi:hypothetical protein